MPSNKENKKSAPGMTITGTHTEKPHNTLGQIKGKKEKSHLNS